MPFMAARILRTRVPSWRLAARRATEIDEVRCHNGRCGWQRLRAAALAPGIELGTFWAYARRVFAFSAAPMTSGVSATATVVECNKQGGEPAASTWKSSNAGVSLQVARDAPPRADRPTLRSFGRSPRLLEPASGGCTLRRETAFWDVTSGRGGPGRHGTTPQAF